MEEENTKGNMSSTWWIVIVIAVLIVIALVAKFVIFAPAPENAAAGGGQQQQQQQVINVTEGKMLSGLICADGKLTAVFTNIQSVALDLTKDAVFSVNDAVDKTPGCEKTVLNPRESTTCSGLDIVKPGYKPSVVVKVGIDKEVITTHC